MGNSQRPARVLARSGHARTSDGLLTIRLALNTGLAGGTGLKAIEPDVGTGAASGEATACVSALSGGAVGSAASSADAALSSAITAAKLGISPAPADTTLGPASADVGAGRALLYALARIRRSSK